MVVLFGNDSRVGTARSPAASPYFVLLLVDIPDVILGSRVWGRGAVLSLESWAVFRVGGQSGGGQNFLEEVQGVCSC